MPKTPKRSLTLWFSDSHFPKVDKRAWGCFLDAVDILKPDGVWCGGDLVDMASVTHHEKTPEDRGLTMKKELESGKAGLAEVRRAAGRACREFLLVQGNHEYRLDRYLASGACPKELMDWLPANVDEGLDLKRTGWEYIGRERQAPYMAGDLAVCHGLWYPANHAQKHVTTLGCNVIYGHTHRPQSHTIRKVGTGSITATGSGCLRVLERDWEHMKAAAFTGWSHGFVVISWDGRRSHCTNVLIHNGRAAYAGITFRDR